VLRGVRASTMSWEDSRGSGRGGNDDLMGVHGDVLFADPLGIRKEKAKPPQPAAPLSGASRSGALREPRSAPARASVDSRDDDLDMNLPEHRRAEINRTALLEEAPAEDPGPLRTWFGYIFGGGTQCCGNRAGDKDSALAKKASMTGRPPQPRTAFPEPGSRTTGAAPSNEATNGRHRSSEPEPVEERNAPPRGAPPPRGDDPFATKHGAPPPRGEEPFAANKRSGGGGLDELHKFSGSNDPPAPAPQQQQRQQPEEDRLQDTVGPPSRHGPPQDSFAALEREKPPEGHLPRKWIWPQFTLNTKEALIEVFVTDEDSGDSRWCQAQPQFRVVDKEGHDAYLCAEYNWDGEYYVQDFGPHHVRKRGQDMTVFELFSMDPSTTNDTDFMQGTIDQTKKSNMNDTDPFLTTRPAGRPMKASDSGGGVGAWLAQD